MANFNERRHGQKRYIFLPTLLWSKPVPLSRGNQLSGDQQWPGHHVDWWWLRFGKLHNPYLQRNSHLTVCIM
jgi:hypothetical protein